MRIEGGSYLGRQIRGVWHCEQMKRLICEWVDTDTAQYAEYNGNKWPNHMTIKQAKKILFERATMMIYINPIADEDNTEQVHGKETIDA